MIIIFIDFDDCVYYTLRRIHTLISMREGFMSFSSMGPALSRGNRLDERSSGVIES